jgi:hypothetical protein
VLNGPGALASKTVDAEKLAALMTLAKSLLALGDIAAARLLLEGVARPPALARRTRNSVSLNFRTNLYRSGGYHASVP